VPENGRSREFHSRCSKWNDQPVSLLLSLANQTFRLTVAGSGNPNLICIPSTWHSIFIFFATNYLAHAASVKCLPGEGIWEYTFIIITAIIYPYAGLKRGLESIFSRAIFASNPIAMATRASAFCIVVRSSSWKPATGQQSISGVAVHQHEWRHRYGHQSSDIELGSADEARFVIDVFLSYL
jgi:hypothetical protein